MQFFTSVQLICYKYSLKKSYFPYIVDEYIETIRKYKTLMPNKSIDTLYLLLQFFILQSL